MLAGYGQEIESRGFGIAEPDDTIVILAWPQSVLCLARHLAAFAADAALQIKH